MANDSALNPSKQYLYVYFYAGFQNKEEQPKLSVETKSIVIRDEVSQARTYMNVANFSLVLDRPGKLDINTYPAKHRPVFLLLGLVAGKPEKLYPRTIPRGKRPAY